MENGQIPPPS